MICWLQSGGSSSGGQDGVGWDEYRRNFPPPPHSLTITGTGDARFLLWDLPDIAPSSERLAYDPAIVGFRVYLMRADGEQVLLAETKGTYYRLAAPATGDAPNYAVTALQRSGHESEPSLEIEDKSGGN